MTVTEKGVGQKAFHSFFAGAGEKGWIVLYVVVLSMLCYDVRL